MSIKKSTDGLYHTNISFHGRRYAVTGRTEAQAYKNAGKLRAELEAGRKLQAQGTTLRVFAAEWLKTYHGSDSSNDKRYKELVELHIIPAMGHLKVRDITERQLQDFLNANASFSFSQLSKLRMTLKQMFKKARKNKLIVDDPAEDLVLPDCTAGTHRAITDTERRLLLEVAKTHRGGLYVKIMLYCGLRPGELNALQWKHIDFKEDLIHVVQAVKHDSNTIGPPKSEAGIRDIPIPSALLSDLLSARSAPDAFVCPGCHGQMLTRSSQNRMWKSIVREMNIIGGATVFRNQITVPVIADDLELYCLRHTYCTDLQIAGVPLNVAKELMGHDDISVTANIYTHSSLESARSAITDLDEYHKDLRKRLIEQQKKSPRSTAKILAFPGSFQGAV